MSAAPDAAAGRPAAATGAPGAATAVPGSVDKTGYTGFGSFHSDDVEVLIRQDAAEYSPPALPFLDPADQQRLQQPSTLIAQVTGNNQSSKHTCRAPADGSSSSSGSSKSWGVGARQQFLIDFDRWTFVNHGAFGGTSRPAFEAAQLWRTLCEAQPLSFIDRGLFPQLVRVIRELAAFVNCSPQDLVLLPNATTGLNAVISSMARLLTPADAVFSLDIGYGSVKKMLRAACDASGAQMVTATVTFPLSGPETLVSLVADSLPPNTKLAVFDAVTSNTALVLPVQQLVQLCRDRGIPVLIDGAHALGMLPIDLQQLQPDFYVSNCHKWLCGARGSAMMYISRSFQQHTQPPVLSHGAEAGFLSQFIWDGSRDYAPLLAISSAVKWWKGLGHAAEHCEASKLAAQQDGSMRAAAHNGSMLAAEQDGSTLAAGQDGSMLAAEQGSSMLAAGQDGSMLAASSAAAAAQRKSILAAAATFSCCDPSVLAHAGDGGAAARCYMYRLLRVAADFLAGKWGTECLGPGSMTAAMTLVRLPEGGVLPAAGAATSADAKYIQDMLHLRYSVEVPIKTIQNTLYVRISAHVYNTLDDYRVLAAAVQELQQQQQKQQ